MRLGAPTGGVQQQAGGEVEKVVKEMNLSILEVNKAIEKLCSKLDKNNQQINDFNQKLTKLDVKVDKLTSDSTEIQASLQDLIKNLKPRRATQTPENRLLKFCQQPFNDYSPECILIEQII